LSPEVKRQHRPNVVALALRLPSTVCARAFAILRPALPMQAPLVPVVRQRLNCSPGPPVQSATPPRGCHRQQLARRAPSAAVAPARRDHHADESACPTSAR
jgi:hypothetical protein